VDWRQAKGAPIDYELATENALRRVTVQGDEVLGVESCGASQWAITVRKVVG